MPKIYNEVREQQRVSELNTLLKLFGHLDRVSFKLPPPYYRRSWRIFPFLVFADNGSEYHKFETFDELHMYVHRTMIPSAQRFAGGLRPHVVCPACEDGGWIMSSYQASGSPNMKKCDTCYNPLGLPCP